ncbi:MAG: DUF4339 domain-containing protein [Verrucomicrobiota bacterium]|jgi:hypothetical protein
MGKADYYILIGGSETGPWTLGQVQAFWRAGAVTSETLYAQPGAAAWKPLSAILDVAPPATPTPPPQQENNPAIPDTDDTGGKPEQPEDMDLTKLRQWLRDNFESYLSHFSNEEQEQAFGKEALHQYRTGKLTPAGLMGQDTNEITLQKFRSLDPRLDYESGAAEQGAREGAEAATRIRQQRMDELLGKLKSP